MERKMSSVASRCLGAVLAAVLAAAGSVIALPASSSDYGRLVLDSEIARAFDEGRQFEGGGTGRFVHGMWILDSGGRKVGVWFSELDRTTVRMHGAVEVEISTPGRILDLRPDAGHNVIWGR
jgi:hypothetical protein